MNNRAPFFLDPQFCRSKHVQTETKNGMVKYPLSFDQSHSHCRGSPVANGRQRVKNRLFAISHHHFGSRSSLTTHFEGFIEPNRLPLQSDTFISIKIH